MSMFDQNTIQPIPDHQAPILRMFDCFLKESTTKLVPDRDIPF